MTFLLLALWFCNCQTKHDSFARNSPISTVLTVECFLEVILSIYHFKRVNFLFENGMVESNTCEQYGLHNGGENAIRGILLFHVSRTFSENISRFAEEFLVKQALDLGHLSVAIPPARKCIYRCYIFKGTCLMFRIGLKAMNGRQYPSTI